MAGICPPMANLKLGKDRNGNPLIKDCLKYSFGNFYASPESSTLFRAIYNNNEGMQDKFVAFWVHVAKKFANNKYVMGFDPLNEPTTGIDNLLQAVYHIWDDKIDKD
jgi:hypothetical protein